ncbi:MAG: hypothetical protein ACPGXK_13680 [Phycisphaerae bacterium]
MTPKYYMHRYPKSVAWSAALVLAPVSFLVIVVGLWLVSVGAQPVLGRIPDLLLVVIVTFASLFGTGWVATSTYNRLRWQRVDYPACYACGYDMTGNTTGACPECGTLVSFKNEPDET